MSVDLIMGNNPTLTQTDLTRLQGETTFSQKEIKRIFKRFAKLDKYGRGGVTTHDLCVLPEIDKNPMGDRVCSVLGGTDNIVDFELFVKTLSDFNQREESEAKLKCKKYTLSQSCSKYTMWTMMGS